jgi:hypothetical protein
VKINRKRLVLSGLTAYLSLFLITSADASQTKTVTISPDNRSAPADFYSQSVISVHTLKINYQNCKPHTPPDIDSGDTDVFWGPSGTNQYDLFDMLGRKKISVKVKGSIIPQQSGGGSGEGGPINPLDFFVNMTTHYMAVSVVKPVVTWAYISSKHDVEAMVVLSNGSPAQQGQINFTSNNSSFNPSSGAINSNGRVYSEATFSNTANKQGNVLATVSGVNVGGGVTNAIGEKSSHLITTYDFYYAFLNPNLLRGHTVLADIIFRASLLINFACMYP